MSDKKISTQLNTLIWKIIKKNVDKKARERILTILLNTATNNLLKFMNIINIYNKFTHNESDSNNDSNKKNFIGDKIMHYITSMNIPISNDSTIMDIGGGNGDMLQYFSENIHIPKDKLICIESVSDWYEPYTYTNGDIVTYQLWDSVSPFAVIPNALDIVFIMVALHHMSDDTITNVFTNLQTSMKSGAYLFIKEHDCQSFEDNYVIDWEHHLYHIIEADGNALTKANVEKYFQHIYISNFKSKAYFNSLICSNGFELVSELNRFAEPSLKPNEYDAYNPTKLYWNVYSKR